MLGLDEGDEVVWAHRQLFHLVNRVLAHRQGQHVTAQLRLDYIIEVGWVQIVVFDDIDVVSIHLSLSRQFASLVEAHMLRGRLRQVDVFANAPCRHHLMLHRFIFKPQSLQLLPLLLHFLELLLPRSVRRIDFHLLCHPFTVLFFVNGALFQVLGERLVDFLTLLDPARRLHQLYDVLFTHIVRRDKII